MIFQLVCRITVNRHKTRHDGLHYIYRTSVLPSSVVPMPNATTRLEDFCNSVLTKRMQSTHMPNVPFILLCVKSVYVRKIEVLLCLSFLCEKLFYIRLMWRLKTAELKHFLIIITRNII